jgi:hypothetical protein
MGSPPKNPPQPASLTAGMEEILSSLDPRGMFFPAPDGRWMENPRRPVDCLIHETIHRFRLTDPPGRESLIQRFAKASANRDLWSLGLEYRSDWACLEGAESPASGGDGVAPAGKSPLTEAGRAALIAVTALARLIWAEAVRILSAAPIPSWDIRGRKKKEAYGRILRLLEDHMAVSLGPSTPETGVPPDLGFPPELHEGLPQLQAQETGLFFDLDRLLAQAESPETREEAWGRIYEKLQPPMGIVTNTSPALLRPCIWLLSKDLDPASGIPYQASVILSILRDRRSTRTLLRGLETYPLSATKIRENLSYALGSLREEGAVRPLRFILSGPDQAIGADGKSASLLIDQKAEALRALGKIGLPSLDALGELARCVDHPSDTLKTHLAWSLGEIGTVQKSVYGGVSADILIALLRLLKIRNREVFEESTKALTRIHMPQFIHALYLYNVSAVSLLGLKSSQRGLFELSETIHHLIRRKGRAIIAVTGHSGTGKTYLCRAIKDGFGGIPASEVLYLMRDRKRDQKVFNRILGLRWLKKHIDPIYYSDYPLREEEDDPEEYFRLFLQRKNDKKLIILDGCRDRNYFQRVIDLFYIKGELDAVLNLRAAFSSRRRNLEEREVALESLRNHLSFLEEPVLEDTLFYREGRVILYDLDNSIDCRLEDRDIREVFSRQRIPDWGSMIRLGEFPSDRWTPETGKTPIMPMPEPFSMQTESLSPRSPVSFKHGEQLISPQINQDLQNDPYFLLSIRFPGIQPVRMARYAQNQVAGCGRDGGLFVLTFEDKRLFWAEGTGTAAITLLGRDFFLFGKDGALTLTSFEKSTRTLLQKTSTPANTAAPLLTSQIVTGHDDGSLRIWDMEQRRVTILQGGAEGILALCTDYSGRIYSSSRDGFLRRWDLREGCCQMAEMRAPAHRLLSGPEGYVYGIGPAPEGSGGSFLEAVHFGRKSSQLYSFPWPILSFSRTADRRLVLTLDSAGDFPPPGTILLFLPLEDRTETAFLSGHPLGTTDCLVTGPEILSCGGEAEGETSLKIWGGRNYVRSRREKLKLSAG